MTRTGKQAGPRYSLIFSVYRVAMASQKTSRDAEASMVARSLAEKRPPGRPTKGPAESATGGTSVRSNAIAADTRKRLRPLNRALHDSFFPSNRNISKSMPLLVSGNSVEIVLASSSGAKGFFLNCFKNASRWSEGGIFASMETEKKERLVSVSCKCAMVWTRPRIRSNTWGGLNDL